METETAKEIAIPEIVKQELSKHQIIESQLREASEKCLSLTLENPTDKAGYLIIEENRKTLKRTRVILTKTFKAHRDQVNLVVKDNLAAEKAFEAIISPAETHLEEQAAIYENEQERLINEAAEKLRLEEEARLEGIRKAEQEKQQRINARRIILIKLGATETESTFELGILNANKEHLLICDDSGFEIALNNFIHEAEKIKIAKEEEVKELKEQKEAQAETARLQAKKEKELQEQQAAIDEQNRKASEAKQKEEKEKKEKAYNKIISKGNTRIKELVKFGRIDTEEEAAYYVFGDMSENDFFRLREEWIIKHQETSLAAQKRAEALKPDKEKLLQLAKDLAKFPFPKMVTEEGKKIALEVKRNVTETALFINEQIKKLK